MIRNMLRPAALCVAAGFIFLFVVGGFGYCGIQGEASAPAALLQAVRLNVRVSGLRNDRGSVLVALFQGSKGFPDGADTDGVTRQAIRIPESRIVTATFGNLKPGEYAVALIHDENNNGKLDTSFGFPLEGFGTSNNPRTHWGAPTYRESRFTLNPGDAKHEMTITIEMRYLSGQDDEH